MEALLIFLLLREKNTWFLCHQWMIWGLIYCGSVCHASACVIYLMVHLVKWSIKSFEKCQQVWEKKKTQIFQHQTHLGCVCVGGGGANCLQSNFKNSPSKLVLNSHFLLKHAAGSQQLFSLKRQQTTGQGGFNFPSGQWRHILLVCLSSFPSSPSWRWPFHRLLPSLIDSHIKKNDFYFILRLKPFFFFSAATKKQTLYTDACFFVFSFC